MKSSIFRFVWLTFLGGWLLAVAISASADELEDFQLPHALTLEPITSAEMLKAVGLSRSSINLHTLSIQSFHGDGGLRTHQSGLPAVQQAIARTYSAVWQIKAPERIRPETLNVNYRLVSCGGKTNALSYADDPSSSISVALQALPPSVIGTETRVIPVEETEIATEVRSTGEIPDEHVEKPDIESTPPKTQIKRFNVIQGGILVQLSPDHFSEAGSYCGTLTVSVKAD